MSGPPDFAGPDMSIFGSFACPDSIDGYCQGRACEDMFAAESNCANDIVSHPGVDKLTCGDIIIIEVVGVDGADQLVYDGVTGQLVGILGYDPVYAESCLAGPSMITIPACTETVLCSRQ